MNIFASYNDPIKSAQVLDNKRLVKMILESAQLLSTALSCYGCVNAPYKVTHKNHPCSIWAKESKYNYKWLLAHFKALCNEYTFRYNKFHKCESLLPIFINNINIIPEKEMTPFPNCTIYKEETDVNFAYRKYLYYKWDNDKFTPNWGKTIYRPFILC